MATYVRIEDVFGATVVVEVFNGTKTDIKKRYHPDFVATLIDVSGVSPSPDQWWTYDGTTFQPPAA